MCQWSIIYKSLNLTHVTLKTMKSALIMNGLFDLYMRSLKKC